MPNDESPLSAGQLKDLVKLFHFFHEQAMRCAAADAYLPACIMLGSALETLLLVFAGRFPEEALSTEAAKKYKLHEKHLLKWDFNELLDIAYNAGWLPAAAATNDPEELKKIDLASFGHVVRRVRNLVHAAKYLKEMKGKDVTPAFLRSCFKISLDAYDCLVKALAGRKKRN
jgi:hypothetical protein